MTSDNHRILIVDDNRAIHGDFRKVLFTEDHAPTSELDWIKTELLGQEVEPSKAFSFELDSAYQGQDAVEMVRNATQQGRPYALAFVDVRMPPGWDGIQTIGHLWEVAPDLEVVICSAFSDYTRDDIVNTVGETDQLLFLKKPYEAVEVSQLAHALTRKWNLRRMAERRTTALESMVKERTVRLEAANRRLEDEAREREQMEEELRLAQKLEAIGQLAAGVAHEINTPIQYVGDNTSFVTKALSKLDVVLDAYGELVQRCRDTDGFGDLIQAVECAEKRSRLEFIRREVPLAVQQMQEGLGEVAHIVEALREFSHGGNSDEQTIVDLNHAISTTLTVARNEYKYAAEVTTELGDGVQSIPCVGGGLNQVLLNLVVNAAQAIREHAEPGEMGRIHITSERRGGEAIITIEDDGPGVPEAIRHRVFDPFFTTKPVGEGTGQGLVISRKIIARQGGRLSLEDGRLGGARFVIALPAARTSDHAA